MKIVYPISKTLSGGTDFIMIQSVYIII